MLVFDSQGAVAPLLIGFDRLGAGRRHPWRPLLFALLSYAQLLEEI